MIVYTVPGCPLCRKIKAVLREKNIRYQEKSLYASLLDDGEREILLHRLTAAGLFPAEDIPDRSAYLLNHPSILPRPLIFEEEGDTEADLSSYERLCQGCKIYPVCAGVRQK